MRDKDTMLTSSCWPPDRECYDTTDSCKPPAISGKPWINRPPIAYRNGSEPDPVGEMFVERPGSLVVKLGRRDNKSCGAQQY